MSFKDLTTILRVFIVELRSKCASPRRLSTYRLIVSRYTSCQGVRNVSGQLKCDSTRAETSFRLSAKRTSPFKSVDYWQPMCAHQR